MYTSGAAYYDVLYRHLKDYPAEVDALRALLETQGVTHGRVLDVACGSGQHADLLSRWYRVEGLDLNEDLLDLARKKNLDSVHSGDMRTFDLGVRYDAVLCLFNAIAYLRSAQEVVRAVARMAAHLVPGGVVVVEPWFGPGQWDPRGSRRLDDVRSGQLRVRRRVGCSATSTSSVFRFDYTVDDGNDRATFHEHHELITLSDADVDAAFHAAGLVPHRVVAPPFPRGLVVARAEDRDAG